MSETLVKVENVSKKFCRDLKRSLWYGVTDLGRELTGQPHNKRSCLRPYEFWAVKDVSFELERGECLALIGHNGAGKSTLLRMLNGLIKPDNGRIEMRGRIGALIALGAGFNPILTGRENIHVNASILGFSSKETRNKFDDIVDFSGLNDFIDTPVQHYSSGMQTRLGFSIAASLSPDILLIDEALAVGDVKFTIKCLNRIADLQQQGTGILFVSHNELQVRRLAQRGILLTKGTGILYDDLDAAYLEYEKTSRIDSEYKKEPDETTFSTEISEILAKIEKHSSEKIIRVGDKIFFDIAITCNHICNNCELELRIWNSLGMPVSVIRSLSMQKAFQLQAGKSVIRVGIDSLNLAPGRYRLAGGVTRQGKALAWSPKLLSFNVSPSSETWIGQGSSMLKGTIEGPRTHTQ